MEQAMEFVQVKFLKDFLPYKEGDIGEVAQMIVDQYPDYVEPVKTKGAKKVVEVMEDVKAKEVDTAPNKAMKKKSTK